LQPLRTDLPFRYQPMNMIDQAVDFGAESGQKRRDGVDRRTKSSRY
jgi:hypothetical protein